MVKIQMVCPMHTVVQWLVGFIIHFTQGLVGWYCCIYWLKSITNSRLFFEGFIYVRPIGTWGDTKVFFVPSWYLFSMWSFSIVQIPAEAWGAGIMPRSLNRTELLMEALLSLNLVDQLSFSTEMSTDCRNLTFHAAIAEASTMITIMWHQLRRHIMVIS